MEEHQESIPHQTCYPVRRHPRDLPQHALSDPFDAPQVSRLRERIMVLHSSAKVGIQKIGVHNHNKE